MADEVNSAFRDELIRQLANYGTALERLENKVDQLRVEKIAELRGEINDARREAASAVNEARAAASAEIARVRFDADKDASALRATTGEKFAALTAKNSLWGGLSGIIGGVLAAIGLYLAKGGH